MTPDQIEDLRRRVSDASRTIADNPRDSNAAIEAMRQLDEIVETLRQAYLDAIRKECA